MNEPAFLLRSTISAMVECLCSMGITEDCPRHRALKNLDAVEARVAELEDCLARVRCCWVTKPNR